MFCLHKFWIVIASLAGVSAVALGAYARHGLGGITPDSAGMAAQASMQTAVMYQLLHALALLATGIWAQRRGGYALAAAGSFFVMGLLLFCGLIYMRHLAGFDALRGLVPFGGVCFMLGWLGLGLAAIWPEKPQNG